MANNTEESSPLLERQQPKPEVNNSHEKKLTSTKSVDGEDVKKYPSAMPVGWTADGLPLGHGSVMGEPISGRAHWDSSLCACLGRNDEFCGSDLEVCLLGSVAPCVLYGSTAERVGSAPGTFANHCLPYTALYLLGYFVFGRNCLAPCSSYAVRTAIRRRFNLEGSCEALTRSCGCCGSFIEDEVQREQCETACDFATHVFCHACALCQEGREVRRRVPHPGFNAQQVLIMIPPAEQTMGRAA